MQEPVFGFAIELCRIRQLLYDLHQELQQSYSIVSGYIAVTVTVTVQLGSIVQDHRTRTELVQQNGISNIYTSVKGNVAINDGGCFGILFGGGDATKCELTILTPSLLAISNIFKK